jgi:hypothetical protein
MDRTKRNENLEGLKFPVTSAQKFPKRWNAPTMEITRLWLKSSPDGFENLVQALDALSDALYVKPTKSRKGERLRLADRDRLVHTLRAISAFLETLHWLKDDGRQLEHLATALIDLKHGIVHPVLKAPKFNSPPDPTEVWKIRARVAFAVELYLRTGKTRTVAAAKIAKDYPELSKITKDNSNLVTAILSWRDDFKKGRIKNRDASEDFAFAMSHLAAELSNEIVPAASLEGWAECWLRDASAFSRGVKPPFVP